MCSGSMPQTLYCPLQSTVFNGQVSFSAVAIAARAGCATADVSEVEEGSVVVGDAARAVVGRCVEFVAVVMLVAEVVVIDSSPLIEVDPFGLLASSVPGRNLVFLPKGQNDGDKVTQPAHLAARPSGSREFLKKHK